MKIGLIGNSHLGHAMSAWREIGARHPDVDFYSFIDRTYGDKPLIISNSAEETEADAIRLLKIAGNNLFDIAKYDAVAIFALHYSYSSHVDLYASHRTELNERGDGTSLVSTACHDAILDAIWCQSKAGVVLDAVEAQNCRIPVFYVPQPFILQWAMDRTDSMVSRYQSVIDNSDQGSLLDDLDRRYALLEASGISVIRQPQHTVVDSIFTRSEFGLAEVSDSREDSLFSRGDYHHMNAAYGDLIVQELITQAVSMVGS